MPTYPSLTPAQSTAQNTTQNTTQALSSLSFLLDAGSLDGPAAAGHAATLELFEVAESFGYDGGWLRDHPAPLVVLGALSQRTTRIGLGTWVTAPASTDGGLPLPDLATVDTLSGGRLSILLGPAAGGTSVTLGQGETVRRVLLPLDSAGPATARRYRDLGDGIADHPHTFDVPVLVGTSEQLLAVLAADPLVAAASDLRVEIPATLPGADQAQVLHDIAAYLAPELGWARAHDVVAVGRAA